jgi:hypothetical protein
VPQIVQRPVRLFQPVQLDRCPHRHSWGERQERFAILSGQVGNGTNHPFFPQPGIWKRWNIAHVDTSADDDAAFLHRAERLWDERPHRREDERCLQLFRRRFVRTPCPDSSELSREDLTLQITRPGEGINGPPLPHGHLRENMCRSTEAIKTQSLGLSRKTKRTIADQPGTEERCCLLVRVTRWNRKAIALVSDRVLSEAAIQRVPSEAGTITEVLAPASAIATLSARPAEPGHADSLTGNESIRPRPGPDNLSDDLMPEDERQLWTRQLPSDDMEVGPADTTGTDPEQDLARTRLRDGKLLENQGLPRSFEHHRPHAQSSSSGTKATKRQKAASPPLNRQGKQPTMIRRFRTLSISPPAFSI